MPSPKATRATSRRSDGVHPIPFVYLGAKSLTEKKLSDISRQDSVGMQTFDGDRHVDRYHPAHHARDGLRLLRA